MSWKLREKAGLLDSSSGSHENGHTVIRGRLLKFAQRSTGLTGTVMSTQNTEKIG